MQKRNRRIAIRRFPEPTMFCSIAAI